MGGDLGLRLYDVTVGAHRTRMQLNDRDAAIIGVGAVLVPEEPDSDPEPAPPHEGPPETPGKSRLVTSNKARGLEPERGSREGAN